MKLSQKELEDLLGRVGIKGLVDELLPLPKGEYELSADNPNLKEHIVSVYPRTLEDVRALVGTRLKDGELHKEKMNLPEYMVESCNMVANGNDADYKVLRDIANRIVHFPCSETEELIENSDVYKEAAQKTLELAQGIPVLAAESLDVLDGEVYTISTPVAVFGAINVYGSGKICFGTSQVKLSADSFNYYPNDKGEE